MCEFEKLNYGSSDIIFFVLRYKGNWAVEYSKMSDINLWYFYDFLNQFENVLINKEENMFLMWVLEWFLKFCAICIVLVLCLVLWWVEKDEKWFVELGIEVEWIFFVQFDNENLELKCE